MADIADSEQALENPVLLLDGLRHFAGRLALFCQAGRIAVPRKYNLLFRDLKDMIVPGRTEMYVLKELEFEG